MKATDWLSGKQTEGSGSRTGRSLQAFMPALLCVLALLIAGLLAAGCGSGKLGSEENPIIMSFAPTSDAPEIIARGNQIAQMITDRTDLVVQASPAPSFVAVREAMADGGAHIGWLDALNYVPARQRHGVELGLVTERLGSTSYRGQFNVRADRGFNSLQDIPGSVMCFVDTSSNSGYVMPRITLQANGIDPDTDFAQTLQLYSHQNVIAEVYNGGCDVGATYADARSLIASYAPEVEQEITILATTANIPYDSISFAEEMPEEMREQVIQSLLEISGTEEGRAALEVLYGVTGLQRADDAIYDGFRAELAQAGVDIEDLTK